MPRSIEGNQYLRESSPKISNRSMAGNAQSQYLGPNPQHNTPEIVPTARKPLLRRRRAIDARQIIRPAVDTYRGIEGTHAIQPMNDIYAAAGRAFTRDRTDKPHSQFDSIKENTPSSQDDYVTRVWTWLEKVEWVLLIGNMFIYEKIYIQLLVSLQVLLSSS